jgi:hypothetical protein
VFYDVMSTSNQQSIKVGSWFSGPDRVKAPVRTARLLRTRQDEERVRSGRIAIVSSLFLALVAAALVVGGHAVIDPLLQSAVETREANGSGDVVYAMPDGIFCRRVSVDNVTAEISGGGVERCPSGIARDHPRAAAPRNFDWGGRH